MLTIIIGIVLAVISLFILIPRCNDSIIVTSIFLLFAVGAFGIGISPSSGYEEWELMEETELISLANDITSGGTGLIYVSLSADNAYTYRYEINSEFGTETSREYKTATLTSRDVEEIEDSNCQVPVIRVYQRHAKKTVWTLGWASETRYVFYVPEGTISKEVKLN